MSVALVCIVLNETCVRNALMCAVESTFSHIAPKRTLLQRLLNCMWKSYSLLLMALFVLIAKPGTTLGAVTQRGGKGTGLFLHQRQLLQT